MQMHEAGHSLLNDAWAKQEYTFEPKVFRGTTGGHAMSYLDQGAPDAPVMLMVHGNPTWSFYYRRLVRAFEGTHRCVAPDHVGMGLSERPAAGTYDFHLASRVADLEALVLALDLRDITLVVHDWGGAIGMGVAVRHPERFKRFVIFNTAAFRSERIPFSIDICRIPGFGALSVRGLNAFARVAQVRAIADRARLDGAVGEGYLAPYDSWHNREAILRFVEDIPMDSNHPSWLALGAVDDGIKQFKDHPMLIVWGLQDFCFDKSFLHEWQRRFPDAEVHALPDASHYVVEDAHERIIPWMQAFIERAPVARTVAAAPPPAVEDEEVA